MTSREQFEKAWETNNECDPMDGWENLRCEDGYTDEVIDGQWWAWQASREAVEVELPTAEPDRGSDSQVDISAGFSNRMRSKCIESIRAAGIKVKGE